MTLDLTSQRILVTGGGRGIGAATVRLLARLGARVLGSIPLDAATRIAGDAGTPVVLSGPESPAAEEFGKIAAGLPVVKRSLLGRSLPLTVV